MKMSALGQWRSWAAASLLIASVQPAAAWERAHSDGPNSGFADVATLPAERPGNVTGLGTFAAGSGPVIAADGTVYLGNQQGQLIALQADGARKWAQSITPGFATVAAPVVDSEGSIYVIGTRTVRNEQANPPLTRYDSSLYKFTPAGQLAWQTRFPNGWDGPTTTAPANIWKSGGAEVVMAPAYYRNKVTGGYEGRIVAFSKAGVVLDDAKFVTSLPSAIADSEYSSWCAIPPVGLVCILTPDFNPSGGEYHPDPATDLPEGTAAPNPAIAIFTYASAGTPFVLVADQQQDLVAFTFVNNRFNLIFRERNDRRWFRSPPMVKPDGHTMIATADMDGKGSISFFGPNMNAIAPVKDIRSFAAPTQMADGRIAIVGIDRQLRILRNGNRPGNTIELPGQSIVSAAASRNHLFVATAGSFLTYDATTTQKLAEIFWMGGGTITPAIGPQGHVYGMASNVLFVFPPPRPASAAPDVAGTGTGTPGVIDPAPPPATAASQRFGAPVTPAGIRLFACQELDGDDCGGSTNKAVALAFCQQKGFTGVADVDTETRKGKAARMDGQLCSKNKCKVFDEIACKN
jgi:outer membrane protein assembly factor BamB